MILQKGKFNIGPIDACSWGSGGKSKIADFIASTEEIDYAIAHNSHNASHVSVWDQPIKGFTTYKFNCLPSSVANEKVKVVLGADSAVQLPKLLEEIKDWELTPERLFIHPNMPIIQQHHIDWEEENLARIGSTMSGVGACKGFKAMRTDTVTADQVEELKPFIANTNKLIVGALKGGQTILQETAQGFDLSMDLLYGSIKSPQKFYPACTSRNINASAFAGYSFVPHNLIGAVIMNLRTLGIRVGDNSNSGGDVIFKFCDGSEKAYKYTDSIKVTMTIEQENDAVSAADPLTMTISEFELWIKNGNKFGRSITIDEKQFKRIVKLGSSGGCYNDQKELTWAEVSAMTGQNFKEQTSLTKRIRRIFTKSVEQLQTSTMACAPTIFTLNFVNYLDKNIESVSGAMTRAELLSNFPKVAEHVQWVEENQYWAGTPYAGKVLLLGTGAKRSEMIELCEA